jgi:glycosyltransferase involved in cell wall biosynthesis
MSIVLLGQRLEMLRDAGADVHVVVGDDNWDQSIVPEGVSVHVIPMSRSIAPAQDVAALWKWMKLLRILRPDAVVGATPKGALLATASASLSRVPVRIFEVWGAAWDGRGDFLGKLLRWCDRLCILCATDTLSVSHSLSQLLVSSGVAKHEPAVLGAGGSKGVDVFRFHPREKATFDPHFPTLGFIGRLSSSKGASDLLEAFEFIKLQLPAAKLLIVGDFDDSDPLDAQTRTKILTAPDIAVSGWVSDPSSLIRQMDLLLFPSRREGLPNAILEASASGVPTVAYIATGSTDAIVSGETGLLVSPGDSIELARQSLVLLRDERRRNEMCRAARAWVEKNFGSIQIAESYSGFILSKLRT